MRVLNKVRYIHTNKLSEEQKDELIIPEEYDGIVAIEYWNVNGKLKTRAVCVNHIVEYIKGFGEFKEDEKLKKERK